MKQATNLKIELEYFFLKNPTNLGRFTYTALLLKLATLKFFRLILFKIISIKIKENITISHAVIIDENSFEDEMNFSRFKFTPDMNNSNDPDDNAELQFTSFINEGKTGMSDFGNVQQTSNLESAWEAFDGSNSNQPQIFDSSSDSEEVEEDSPSSDLAEPIENREDEKIFPNDNLNDNKDAKELVTGDFTDKENENNKEEESKGDLVRKEITAKLQNLNIKIAPNPLPSHDIFQDVQNQKIVSAELKNTTTDKNVPDEEIKEKTMSGDIEVKDSESSLIDDLHDENINFNIKIQKIPTDGSPENYENSQKDDNDKPAAVSSNDEQSNQALNVDK